MASWRDLRLPVSRRVLWVVVALLAGVALDNRLGVVDAELG
jgi:hypothetical protein